uniref:Uncharacterized protein n=1 Tax=Globodera rostochiensis TaxID=31243 RepID=A0A914GXV6_GLORO
MNENFGNLHEILWVEIGTFATWEAVHAYCAQHRYHKRHSPNPRVVYYECYRRRHHDCRYRLKAEELDFGEFQITLYQADQHRYFLAVLGAI